MKKHLILLLILLFTLTYSSFGQKVSVDFREIEKFTETDAYENLLTRYMNDDLNLTFIDYIMLYYGQTFAVDYNPYKVHDSITALYEYLDRESENVDYNIVLKYCQIILEKFPFRLQEILLAATAYKEIGDEYGAEIWSTKFNGLAGAILTSGDGLTPKSAFVVANTSDEYMILEMLGLSFWSQRLLGIKKKWYDLTVVNVNPQGIEEVYFDVSLIVNSRYNSDY